MWTEFALPDSDGNEVVMAEDMARYRRNAEGELELQLPKVFDRSDEPSLEFAELQEIFSSAPEGMDPSLRPVSVDGYYISTEFYVWVKADLEGELKSHVEHLERQLVYAMGSIPEHLKLYPMKDSKARIRGRGLSLQVELKNDSYVFALVHNECGAPVKLSRFVPADSTQDAYYFDSNCKKRWNGIIVASDRIYVRELHNDVLEDWYEKAHNDVFSASLYSLQTMSLVRRWADSFMGNDAVGQVLV